MIFKYFRPQKWLNVGNFWPKIQQFKQKL
jgi:hypothetical protein